MKIDNKARVHEEKRMDNTLIKVSRQLDRDVEVDSKPELDKALKKCHDYQRWSNDTNSRTTENHKALQYEEEANGITLT